MTNDGKNPERKPMKFDLEERTAKFAENVIEFCKKLPILETKKIDFASSFLIKTLPFFHHYSF